MPVPAKVGISVADKHVFGQLKDFTSFFCTLQIPPQPFHNFAMFLFWCQTELGALVDSKGNFWSDTFLQVIHLSNNGHIIKVPIKVRVLVVLSQDYH